MSNESEPYGDLPKGSTTAKLGEILLMVSILCTILFHYLVKPKLENMSQSMDSKTVERGDTGYQKEPSEVRYTMSVNDYRCVQVPKNEHWGFEVLNVNGVVPEFYLIINGDFEKKYKMPGSKVNLDGVKTLHFLLKQGQGFSEAQIVGIRK